MIYIIIASEATVILCLLYALLVGQSAATDAAYATIHTQATTIARLPTQTPVRTSMECYLSGHRICP